MSQNYFDQILGKKVIYKLPLFLIEVKLKKKKGGGVNSTNDINTDWLADDKVKQQYNNALMLTDSIISVLDNTARSILNTNNSDILMIDTPFLYCKKNELKATAKTLYKTTDKNNTFIYKSHSLKKEEAKSFLTNWYKSLDNNTINILPYTEELKLLKGAGFRVGKSYIPRFDINDNPLYATYTLVSKS